MKILSFKTLALLGSVVFLAQSSVAQIISDNFETDSSANYTVVNDGSPNGTSVFGYNYVGAGIPLAPNSLPGDKGGLRFTANDSLAAVDALTAFHNTSLNSPGYRLKVDVYMGFTGTAGTTEHGHVGVGGNGSTFNSIFTPISGSGSFIAFTGDGGSASDYRWYLAAANGGLSTVPNSDASYLGHGSNNTGPFYQSLFPTGTVIGSPGNMWTTLEIDVTGNTISYLFDGQLTIQGTFTGNLNGQISLGLADTFGSSVDPGTVFTLYDNLVVTVPEPTSLALVGLAGFALLARRRI